MATGTAAAVSVASVRLELVRLTDVSWPRRSDPAGHVHDCAMPDSRQ
jgi:hypothetical protein